MRVAIIHDWLVTYRGGEKVLEAICQLYPQAPIYTLFYQPQSMPASLNERRIIYPKWLQPLNRFRKALLPLYPSIIESFNLEDYDLVISSSSCVAKGVMVGPNTKHLSYVHSPMRYIWDARSHYMPKSSIKRALIHYLSTSLRLWDQQSNSRVDALVANSRFVAQRISRYYGRQAQVIPPPVNLKRFIDRPIEEKDDYLLIAGAAVPYKRFDLAINACQSLNIPLVVAGDGPEWGTLKALAGPKTRFINNPSDHAWEDLMARAQAFIFSGIEDFGITAIEAFASGTPVIAARDGGALDFISENKNGLFFTPNDCESLISQIQKATKVKWCPEEIRSTAVRFSEDQFLASLKDSIKQLTQQETGLEQASLA